MDLKVIYKNARCAVLEIEDGGTYEASRMYRKSVLCLSFFFTIF